MLELEIIEFFLNSTLYKNDYHHSLIYLYNIVVMLIEIKYGFANEKKRKILFTQTLRLVKNMKDWSLEYLHHYYPKKIVNDE